MNQNVGAMCDSQHLITFLSLNFKCIGLYLREKRTFFEKTMPDYHCTIYRGCYFLRFCIPIRSHFYLNHAFKFNLLNTSATTISASLS